RQQRVKVGGIVAVLAAVGILGAFLVQGGDSSTDLAAGTDTTDLPPEEEAGPSSVAGKPCVPVAGEPPPGAPEVPVKVGPPPTKLVAEDLKPGTGAVVSVEQTLTVNYIGVSCSTGKIFDSSYETGQPVSFPLSGVIQGWQQGLPGMKVGGQRLLGIPPELAYQDQQKGSDIAPGETLWFVVEVLDAKAA
ncbi:MAG TPA: FKBP-type peptidyl-prolyl cis-trans isomerase, partial [Acidimicrobiales bacterium]|nr:FKBP-type peptidyl-prolyl cis-trans isomerase [Acidimicrobiales bacterium]